jgi:hypothetical protein
MIITLTDDAVNGLCPEAVGVLNSKFTKELYYVGQKLRHPYGRYCVSLDNYIKAFICVLDEYEKIKLGKTVLDSDGNWASSIISNQQAFLNAIMEHFDAIEDVVYAFFPDKGAAKSNKHYKNFYKDIKTYRDSVAIVINRVKHNGGTIRALSFYGNGRVVPGYFVEGTSYPHGDTPCVGPDEIVHPGSNSAFSFARDMRMHIVQLYNVSRQLAYLIKRINRPETQNKFSKDCSWIVDVSMRINNIRDGYYFDEIIKPNPSIRVGKTDRTTVQLSYRVGQPKPVSVIEIVGTPWNIMVHWLGDQVSDIYKLPYGGKEYGCPKITSVIQPRRTV